MLIALDVLGDSVNELIDRKKSLTSGQCEKVKRLAIELLSSFSKVLSSENTESDIETGRRIGREFMQEKGIVLEDEKDKGSSDEISDKEIGRKIVKESFGDCKSDTKKGGE